MKVSVNEVYRDSGFNASIDVEAGILGRHVKITVHHGGEKKSVNVDVFELLKAIKVFAQ